MLQRMKENSSQYKYVQEYYPQALQAPESATNKQLQRSLAEDLEAIKKKRNSDFAEIKQLRVELHKLDQYYRHFQAVCFGGSREGIKVHESFLQEISS
jgi:hypothetical protein